MTRFHSFIIILFLLFSKLQFAQYTETINSNIPGMSMSPFAVGKTIMQFEMNAYYISDKNNEPKTADKGKGYGSNIALRYGVWREEFEAVLTAEYRTLKYQNFQTNDKSGLRSLTLGAKYLFYDPFKNYEEKVNVYSWKANQKFKWRRLRPAVAAYLGANINVTNNTFVPVYPSFGPKVALLLHNNLGKGAILTTNIFGNNFLDPSANYGFVATLSKGFKEKYSVFVENESYFGNYRNYIFTLGATYILQEDIQVHAAVSASRTLNFYNGQTYGGIGFSWRFDRNHKPVDLGPKGGSKDKSKKKDDKKEDSKKFEE